MLHPWYSCISSLAKQCQDIWRKHRNGPVIPHCSTPHNISLEICLCFDLCVHVYNWFCESLMYVVVCAGQERVLGPLNLTFIGDCELLDAKLRKSSKHS